MRVVEETIPDTDDSRQTLDVSEKISSPVVKSKLNRLSPDGKQAVFSLGNTTSEVVTIENFSAETK